MINVINDGGTKGEVIKDGGIKETIDGIMEATNLGINLVVNLIVKVDGLSISGK